MASAIRSKAEYMISGSHGATAFRARPSALATISWAARNADRPSGVSSVVRTLPCTGWAIRLIRPSRSSVAMMDCIVCGVTKARRASSALDKPAVNSSPASTEYCGVVNPMFLSWVSRWPRSACCARFSAYPSERYVSSIGGSIRLDISVPLYYIRALTILRQV